MLRVFILSFLFTNFATAQVSIKECSIGQSTIQIQTEQFQPINQGIYFINLHANETTSIASTKEYLTNVGGSFFQLIHGEVRHVSFLLNNIKYKIDPNRIFTSLGRRETLKKNSIYNTSAEKETKKFADSILVQMASPKLIVAMHNNTDKEFSINSYKKGKNEAINAADIYINTQMDADDFVYTTERKIFDYLKLQKINVVLQKAKGFKDDGSLSIYCSNKNIPYINIEAQEGHKEEQLQMLKALTTVIDWYKK